MAIRSLKYLGYSFSVICSRSCCSWNAHLRTTASCVCLSVQKNINNDMLLLLLSFHLPLGHKPSTNWCQACIPVTTSCSSIHVLSTSFHDGWLIYFSFFLVIHGIHSSKTNPSWLTLMIWDTQFLHQPSLVDSYGTHGRLQVTILCFPNGPWVNHILQQLIKKIYLHLNVPPQDLF